MDLIIVSGLSGSGKSIALHALEDLGYFCIDNLPSAMLPSLAVELTRDHTYGVDSAAVSIDSRNREFLRTLEAGLADLKQAGVSPRIVFLEADTERIIERYSETRRRHPLTDQETSLREGILEERQLLAPLARSAERIIDTSITTPQELRAAIRSFALGTAERVPALMFQSFGYKYGAPVEADTVFDLRGLPNPYWEKRLRDKTGFDTEVADFLGNSTPVNEMADRLTEFLMFWINQFDISDRSYLTAGFGCTGGQHRSVYMVERLASVFRQDGRVVQTRHRDLHPGATE